MAMVFIGIGVTMLHTRSIAIAQTGMTRHAAAPVSIAVGLVTDRPEVYDGSFNEMSFMGVLRSASELGTTYQVYTSASEADYAPNLQQCVLDGNALCIAVGFGLADAVSTTAVLYPGVQFAIADASWETMPPNLRGLVFAEDEHSQSRIDFHFVFTIMSSNG